MYELIIIYDSGGNNRVSAYDTYLHWRTRVMRRPRDCVIINVRTFDNNCVNLFIYASGLHPELLTSKKKTPRESVCKKKKIEYRLILSAATAIDVFPYYAPKTYPFYADLNRSTRYYTVPVLLLYVR